MKIILTICDVAGVVHAGGLPITTSQIFEVDAPELLAAIRKARGERYSTWAISADTTDCEAYEQIGDR